MKNGCIVGCGMIAPIHANALSKLNSLYGICDISKDKLHSFTYSAKRKFSNFENVLKDENIDVVHICTPHYLHAQMAIDALASGKNVILEKPVGISMDEFRAVQAAANRSDKKLCVMFQNRTNPSIIKLKSFCDSKIFGEITGATAYVSWSRDEAYYRHDNWRGKWKTEGGGLLINQAVHTLDLCSYLCGNIKSVTGSISNKSLSDVIEVEDTADAIFKTDSGIGICFYATNANSKNNPVQIEIYFENATVRYCDGRLYKITDTDCEIIEYDFAPSLGKAYWGNGHEKVITGFYSLLENGSGSYISINDAEQASRLLFAFYKSAKTGKTVELDTI